MDPSDEDLAQYARITASVSAGSTLDRALAEEGLDEDAFTTLETKIEGMLSAALDASGDAIPPFVIRYERALRQAQVNAQGETKLTLAEFATAVSILSSGAPDPMLALKRAGFELADVIRGISKHAPDLATNPAAAAVFTRLSKPSKRRTPL